MSNLQPRPVLDHKCFLGESPLWDVQHQLVCWVDIIRGELHQYSPEKKSQRKVALNQMVGAIALTSNGHFVAALQHGIGFIDRLTDNISMMHTPEETLPGNRFNDGKCGPDGRFWTGSMAFDETTGAGTVYCLQPDLSIDKKIEAVTISNGMAWNTRLGLFYYTDTPTQTIAVYDYDFSNGNISNKKIAITIPAEEGHPDGMTIDCEGMLWIAYWGGWKIARWNPHTAEKLLEVKLPVSKVTSCTFGGPMLQDLYITTAMKDLSEEELKQQPLAGSLFVVSNCGYTGLPADRFIR